MQMRQHEKGVQRLFSVPTADIYTKLNTDAE